MKLRTEPKAEAAPSNRILKYQVEISTPPPYAPEPLPKGELEREEYLNETFMLSIAALRWQLNHGTTEQRYQAATAYLNLETTRLRHGRRISGTGEGLITEEEHRRQLDEMNGTGTARKPKKDRDPKPNPAPVDPRRSSENENEEVRAMIELYGPTMQQISNELSPQLPGTKPMTVEDVEKVVRLYRKAKLNNTFHSDSIVEYMIRLYEIMSDNYTKGQAAKASALPD